LGLKVLKRRLAFFIVCIVIAGSLWTASEWWEKGLAKSLGDPVISPNGCYRVESFKPFWVLPDVFHREPDPNEDIAPKWFPWWEYPGFYRLYDNRREILVGESKIYDLAYASGPISWGRASRQVYAGMIHIGPNVPDCIGDQPAQPRPTG
jgi:hypothetical protein